MLVVKFLLAMIGPYDKSHFYTIVAGITFSIVYILSVLGIKMRSVLPWN